MNFEVKNLAFSYDGAPVLRDVSFTIEDGDCMAILGTNGTGKSTLLKCLNRILKPKGGTVLLNGRDCAEMGGRQLAKSLAYVAQSQQIARNTVFDEVMLGRKPYIRWDAGKTDMEIVESCIKKLGLEAFSNRYTDELSGGELQKVVIARALAQQPSVLLLDEPTSSLDMKNQLSTVSAIRQIVEESGISVIATMHDLNLALRFANKFLLLCEGEVFAVGGTEIITEENIRLVYDVPVNIREFNGLPVVIPA